MRRAVLAASVSIACLAAPATACAQGGGLKTVTYTTDRPVVLYVESDASLAINVTPDRPLYRTGALPRVAIRSEARRGAVLTYRVLDGFGARLFEQRIDATEPVAAEVPLPPGHGYYEIVAAVTENDRVVAEVRRSFGALPPPAPPVGDEPFGLWIQGDEYYPELGVRWTRDGVNWRSYKRSGERYLESRRKLYQRYRDSGMRVIAYPKHPHPHQVSREVIEDTPEAWRALEAWWTKMVRSLAGHVDAWGVINEPMWRSWKGDNELIVRYWALMRKIVDRYDPGTPLIGPSLSPNEPPYVARYEELLEMGFGRYIDVVEMHTYIDDPEGEWADNTRHIQAATRQVAGRDLPIWSTEHGSSADHAHELLQAQHLMRSWLEAKRMGYPVVIWHMFSHPQGTDQREVQFGIFRNSREKEASPQPRPAGVAYGVMTRQLAGAQFRRRLDRFDSSVYAYLFERGGEAVVALWSTDGKSREIELEVVGGRPVTVTSLFGRTETLEARDGRVSVPVDGSPRFVASSSAALQD